MKLGVYCDVFRASKVGGGLAARHQRHRHVAGWARAFHPGQAPKTGERDQLHVDPEQQQRLHTNPLKTEHSV